jgi:hypothetical protein
VLLCYDYQNGIIDEEKHIIFAIKLKLFSIGIISLLKIIQYVKTIDVEIMHISAKTLHSKLKLGVQIIEQKTIGNRYEPEVAIEDKMYLETYYSH